MGIALNAEFNFETALYGTHGHAQSSRDRAELMDLSHADDDEAELQAVELQRNIRRCHTYGSTRHLRPNCLLRKPRQNRPNRNTAPNQKSGTVRENVDSQ